MKNLAIFFLFSLLALSAHAQITLTSDDFINFSFGIPSQQSISFTSNDTTGLRALEVINGTGATWNFNGRAYSAQNNGGATISLVPYPGGAPLASDPDFASATHVYEVISPDSTQQSLYEFLRIDQTGLWVIGSSQDSLGVLSKQSVANPPYQYYKFPMSFGTSWSYSTIIWNANFGSDTESATAIVDGEGTLITPPSNSNPCLRVNMNYKYGGVDGYSNISFYFLTKSFFSAEIDAESDLTPDDAQYSEPTGSGVAQDFSNTSSDGLNVLLAPNPATNTITNLSYTLPNGTLVQVELMDELGRNVRMLQNGFAPAGKNDIAIDPQSLEAGTYFVRVEADGLSAMQKLVVTR